MKKAFTFIEAVTVLAIIGIIFFIILSFSQPRKTIESTQPATQSPKSFTIVSKEAIGSPYTHPFLYIVRDNETQREYLLVEDGNGVSITPRLKKEDK